MTQILIGVKNFLTLINENWTLIVIIIGLGLFTYRKIVAYMNLSQDAKIELAWKLIKEMILSWVSDAENYWTIDKELSSAGSIKRSEVINKIFSAFPILNQITNQAEVLRKIDFLITEALEELEEILKKQNIIEPTDEKESEENVSD